MLEKLAGIKNIKIFIDDILVFTGSREEHIEILKKLLNRLAEQNIEINFDKTEIMKEKIKYLGFEISYNKYKPDPERITTLNPCKTPKTRRQLQKMLGEMNWYRKFIPNLSMKFTKFYDILKNNNNKIKISDDDMKVVVDIYNDLKLKANLYVQDINRPFEIYTDASDIAIGAVLSQNENIIEYFSKKYAEYEERYSATKKEMLSIFKAVKHWEKTNMRI
ncbi:Retrovirus-related Pol polyprotein from transposon 17.6 [Dictyocoela muelleri]|nr:Retrovirus-related Pol polyprotein from transposon 17.6 [Dictyocoela muelleri]